MIILFIIIYIIGVIIFSILEWKLDKELTPSALLSWIAVLLILYVWILNIISNKLKNRNNDNRN